MTSGPGSTPSPINPNSTSNTSDPSSLENDESEILDSTPGFVYKGQMGTIDDLHSWLTAKANYLAQQDPSQAAQLQQAANSLYDQYTQSLVSWFFNQFQNTQNFQNQQEQDRQALSPDNQG